MSEWTQDRKILDIDINSNNKRNDEKIEEKLNLLSIDVSYIKENISEFKAPLLPIIPPFGMNLTLEMEQTHLNLGEFIWLGDARYEIKAIYEGFREHSADDKATHRKMALLILRYNPEK